MAEECPKCDAGLPAWLATFADLMSLLMCFFVLLLSFAEIDAVRFKKMAEAMKDAFGVQREIPATEIVKGTSVIMQEYSPGIPQPTPIEEIRQTTTDLEKENLDTKDGSQQSLEDLNIDAAKAAMQAKLEQEVQQQAEELQEMLDEEISEGLLEVEREDTKIIIRIQEKGSFPSGRATLNPEFFQVISKITDVIANTQTAHQNVCHLRITRHMGATISINCHTIPLATLNASIQKSRLGCKVGCCLSNFSRTGRQRPHGRTSR